MPNDVKCDRITHEEAATRGLVGDPATQIRRDSDGVVRAYHGASATYWDVPGDFEQGYTPPAEARFQIGAVTPTELEQGYVAFAQIGEFRILLNDQHAAESAALLENLRGAAKLAKEPPAPLPDRPSGAITTSSGVATRRGEKL